MTDRSHPTAIRRLAAVPICAALLLAALSGPARANLNVLITKGVSNPIPIAIVPFAEPNAAKALDVAGVVQNDLDSSGRFHSMARGAMLSTPTQPSQVQAAYWKAAGNEYIVVGQVTAGAGGALQIEGTLINVLTGRQIGTDRLSADAATLRNAAHQISDYVYQQILGVRGAFATRIAYITVTGQPPHQQFRLVVADADGADARTILESNRPIMSPAWSPDGKWLAYVSFESRLPAVYVQRVRTGARRLVSARAGVNGAPAWSPNGKELALTLSGSAGTPNIWLLNLDNQQLTRLTDDPSINTSPVWTPDGKSIYFTSDRGGGPQIFRLDLNDPQRVTRVTFGSSYAADPRVSPDGTELAFVTLADGNYRIALQNLATGTVRILSHDSLDDSPSFAPNGQTIIYVSHGSTGSRLETVSADGQVTQRLDSDQGEVRDPVWGPFMGSG